MEVLLFILEWVAKAFSILLGVFLIGFGLFLAFVGLDDESAD